jgi:hypothetical protein
MLHGTSVVMLIVPMLFASLAFNAVQSAKRGEFLE